MVVGVIVGIIGCAMNVLIKVDINLSTCDIMGL